MFHVHVFTVHAPRSTFHSSHHFQQCFRHLGWGRGNADSGGLEGGDLRCGGSFSAADNRAGMAHSSAWRSSRPGDKTSDGLFAVLLDPIRSFLLGRTSNLADHDYAMRIGISIEHLDNVEM